MTKKQQTKKHKVVYNTCYGGFGLSDEAVKWLENNASDQTVRDFLKEKRTEIENSRKGDDNSLWGTVESTMAYTLMYDYNGAGMPRHHEDLIAVVETLGDDANGMCSELTVAEINSNKYRIDEYDGWESVMTPNDYKWVEIEEEK